MGAPRQPRLEGIEDKMMNTTRMLADRARALFSDRLFYGRVTVADDEMDSFDLVVGRVRHRWYRVNGDWTMNSGRRLGLGEWSRFVVRGLVTGRVRLNGERANLDLFEVDRE